MKAPTTIKGYLAVISMIQKIPVSTLKGFKALPTNKQGDLLELTAHVDNIINNED